MSSVDSSTVHRFFSAPHQETSMKSMFVGALALFALAAPAFAQEGAKPDAGAAPKEEAAKVSEADIAAAKKTIAAIQADKAKLKTYCDTQALYAKADEAAEKKDEKTAEENGKKADAMAKTLGPDYDKIGAVGAELDPESASGKEFNTALEALDKACK
jgi:hypothetical protein